MCCVMVFECTQYVRVASALYTCVLCTRISVCVVNIFFYVNILSVNIPDIVFSILATLTLNMNESADAVYAIVSVP